MTFIPSSCLHDLPFLMSTLNKRTILYDKNSAKIDHRSKNNVTLFELVYKITWERFQVDSVQLCLSIRNILSQFSLRCMDEIRIYSRWKWSDKAESSFASFFDKQFLSIWHISLACDRFSCIGLQPSSKKTKTNKTYMV